MKPLFSSLFHLVFFLCFSFSFAQVQNDWDKIMIYESQGKFKSADQLLDTIIMKAKKQNDDVLFIKCFFLKAKYANFLDEMAFENTIALINKERKTKRVLKKSMLDYAYLHYLEQYVKKNRYDLEKLDKSQRKRTENVSTWGLKEMEQAIEQGYLSLINNPKALYELKIRSFHQLFDFEFYRKDYDKSLLQFLIERRRVYFESKNNVLFSSNSNLDKRLYAVSKDFVKASFTDVSSKNLRLILEDFQLIEALLLQEPKENYLLGEVVMSRYMFLKKEFSYPELASTFLENQSKAFTYKPSVYLIQYLKLKQKFDDHKKGQDHILEEVLFSCDSILKTENPHFNLHLIQNLKSVILNQNLTFKVQSQVVINQPILAHVQYKNIDSIHLFVHKVSHLNGLIENQNGFLQSVSDSLVGLKPFREYHFALPQKFPHDNTSTEFALEGLPNGYYLILFAPDLSLSKVQTVSLKVSSIHLSRYDYENHEYWQTRNFETGEVLSQATILRNNEKFVTNELGEAKININSSEEYFNIIISHQQDSLVFREYNSRYIAPKKNPIPEVVPKQKKIKKHEEDVEAMARVFTDRAIYRPGQTVFFKGIALMKSKKGVIPFSKMNISVEIEDPNGDEVMVKEFTTNEFGSFSGSFEIPKNAPTGQFDISIDEPDEDEDESKTTLLEKIRNLLKSKISWENIDFDRGYASFQVEEYKRPTFEVSLENIKERYAMGDTVKLKGRAKSFAGNNMVNAQVAFEIKKSFHGYVNYKYINLSEIFSEGQVLTDENGAFEILIPLKPIDSIKINKNQSYYFNISTLITDLQGESHEAVHSFRANMQSINLSSHLNSRYVQKDSISIHFSCTNNDYQDLPVNSQFEIFKITKYKQIPKFKTRPWTSPEIQNIPPDEFEKIFPNFQFESNPKIEETRTLVYSSPIQLPKDKIHVIKDLENWEISDYELVYAVEDSRDTVATTSRFKVQATDFNWKSFEKNIDVQWLNKNTFARDKKVFFEIRSFHQNGWVYLTYNDTKNQFQKLFLPLIDGKLQYEIPIDLSMNINLRADILKNGSKNQSSYFFEVFSTAEILNQNIKKTTFRSNIQPGVKETWTFQIQNPQAQKQISEVLAIMYDSSLDQFKKHSWDYEMSRLRDFSEIRPPSIIVLPYSNQYNGQNVSLRYLHFAQNYHNFKYVSAEEKVNFHGYKLNFNNKPYGETHLSRRYLKNPIVITGNVNGDSQPLPGVNVFVKGTNVGTQTDYDGFYRIIAEKGETIAFSYVGFKNEEVIVKDSSQINVRLVEDLNILDGVVVQAYRTVTREKSNIASTAVSSIDFEGRSNTDFIQTLQDQVPGLNIAYGNGEPGSEDAIVLRGAGSVNGAQKPLFIIDGIPVDETTYQKIALSEILTASVLKDAAATSIYGSRGANGVIIIQTKKGAEAIEKMQTIQTRKDFRETAFFMPHVQTDKDGNFQMTFDSPESLTQWKFRLLSHNKNGQFGFLEELVQTQKDLMVQPNTPRFIREGDTLVILNKVSNLTAKEQKAASLLQIMDAQSGKMRDDLILNEKLQQLVIPAFGSSVMAWKIAVPEGLQGLHYKIVAQTDSHTDGEEKIIPVLPRKILVHESQPLWVKSGAEQTINLEHFSNNEHRKNVFLEATWYSSMHKIILQSLPYLIEYEHHCAEQTFSRLFATTTAIELISKSPKLESMLKQWREQKLNLNTLFNDEKLMEQMKLETPWLLEKAFPEKQQKLWADLLEVEALKLKTRETWQKLFEMQNSDGGFPWFHEGSSNSFISRHIALGLGQMKTRKMTMDSTYYHQMVPSLLSYLEKDYLELEKLRVASNPYYKKYYFSQHLHFWYARSHFEDTFPITDSLQTHLKANLDAIQTHFLDMSIYEKSLAALVFHRFGRKDVAQAILTHLKETAVFHENNGVYWKENQNYWRWYQSSVAVQALLMEAFSEINQDDAFVDEMKVWILKQRQSKNWTTTKNTTEAVFALVNYGSKATDSEVLTEIEWGSDNLMQKKLKESKEPNAMGLHKISIYEDEIKPEHQQLKIKNIGQNVIYGGVHRYSLQSIDMIESPEENALSIEKLMVMEVNGKEVILKSGDKVPLGTKITIRLLIHAEQSVDFVHIKDLRAAGFEPIYQESGYQRTRNGYYNSYYQSHRDWVSHFFFDKMSQGKHIIEYEVMTNNMGQFSSGITTIMSMYAPEFSFHTEGQRIEIVEVKK